jgi:hypothetical protein
MRRSFRCRIRTKKRGDKKQTREGEISQSEEKNGGRAGKEEEKEMDEELGKGEKSERKKSR